MHDENCGCGEEHMGGHHMDWPMKKEFKLAMLEKKEKILQAELDFIKRMKELAKNSIDEKEDK
jgi:hypothetical protein